MAPTKCPLPAVPRGVRDHCGALWHVFHQPLCFLCCLVLRATSVAGCYHKGRSAKRVRALAGGFMLLLMEPSYGSLRSRRTTSTPGEMCWTAASAMRVSSSGFTNVRLHLCVSCLGICSQCALLGFNGCFCHVGMLLRCRCWSQALTGDGVVCVGRFGFVAI